MNIRFRPYKTLLEFLWICLLVALPVRVMSQTCTEIELAQLPLEALAPSPAPANVVFLLDDSTSMDGEVLVVDTDSAINRLYLFDDAGDNAISFSVEYFDQEQRKNWRYQWHGYNRLYYNPAVTYEPWPTMANANDNTPRSNPTLASYTQDLDAAYTDFPAPSGRRVVVDDRDVGAVTTTGGWSTNPTEHFTNQNGATLTWNATLPTVGAWSVWVFNLPGNLDDQARYSITHAGGTTQVTRDQNAARLVKLGNYTFGLTAKVKVTRQNSDTTELTNADRVVFLPAGEIIPVAHYYLKTASGTPYLVMLSGGLRYFRVDDQAEGQTGHGVVEDGELVEVSNLPTEIDSCLTYAEDRQNFANWYSYHRKRSLAATSAVANTIAGFDKYQPNSCSAMSTGPEAIDGLRDMQVGLLTLNGTIKQPVLPVKVGGSDQTQTILNSLYTYGKIINIGQKTLLRAGLDSVGRYYSTNISCNALCPPAGSHPMASVADGGGCQKQFVVIVTDGAYNGTAPGGIGNQDGNQGTPYADGYSDTLADVAMKYYKNDLSSVHEDVQRMHTFAVGFGVEGSFDRDSYPANWPNPLDNITKIDDLWHATVNGRGEYYQSDSPDELAVGLQAIKDALLAFSGSSASVSATGEAVESDTTVFVPSYESEFWTGDLKAYTLSKSGAAALKWSASRQLDGIAAASRKIYTFNGTGGVEFEFGSMPSAGLTENEINYLRGDQVNEQQNGGLFRNRPSVLGDIVHSAPAYHDGTVYVGANDGMLHAFSAITGDELFAYVPYLPFQPDPNNPGGPFLSIFDHLPGLTDVNYGDAHRFFVDLTPAVGTVGSADYLVGGLGGGGKGYFCLDVTNPSSFGSSNVKWEFPKSGTSQTHIDDLGDSFSRAMIVETQDGTKVLFGNGYNSTNGHAVLFILNPATGAVDKKIDTGAGGSECNGLSTPVVIDVDNDDIADYAYAGDLKGNLWRFDLTDANTANWKAEHLFQAKGPGSSDNEQPITTQPDAMFHCGGADDGVFITFGTGRYLGESDLVEDDYETQTLYGIWDINGLWRAPADQSAHDWGAFSRLSCSVNDICHDDPAEKDPEAVICDLNSYQGVAYGLLKQTVKDTVPENGNTYRVVSNNPVCWEQTPKAHGGYFLDLPESGERMIADTTIRDFRLIAVSLEPSVEPCTSGGVSYLHVLNACSGGRDPLPQIDVDGDDEITGEDTVSSGSEEVSVSGIEIQGVAPQPLVLRNPDPDGAQTERLVFPQALTGGQGVGGGSSGVVTVRPERRGNYYWREVR